MKKTLLMLLLALSCMHANSQFKSLLSKVKDKVNSKLNGTSAQKDTTTQHPATVTSDTTAVSPDPNSQNTSKSKNGSSVNQGIPQPPVFPVTGKLVKVTTAVFGVDTTRDPAIPWTTRNPALIFAALLNSYNYMITPDFIRTGIGTTDSTNGQAGVAGAMANAFAPGITTIINLKERKSYTVANYLNILPAAIVADMGNVQDGFGLMSYLQKYMHQTDMKLKAMGHGVFHGYQVNIVDIEIPVTPVTDEDGRPSDALLFLHNLLSGGDMMNKHYDPSYKLFVETYYSHDLDAMIPPSITKEKDILQIDGFYVGSLLKDEKGNKVVYILEHIDKDKSVDAGLFMIPDGYEKLTHEQFKQRLREKLHGGK